MKRIAIPYDVSHMEIYPHFGEATNFKLYDVNKGEILHDQIITLKGGQDANVGQMYSHGVTLVLCDGISRPLKRMLAEACIDVETGYRGNPNEVVLAYLQK